MKHFSKKEIKNLYKKAIQQYNEIHPISVWEKCFVYEAEYYKGFFFNDKKGSTHLIRTNI